MSRKRTLYQRIVHLILGSITPGFLMASSRMPGLPAPAESELQSLKRRFGALRQSGRAPRSIQKLWKADSAANSGDIQKTVTHLSELPHLMAEEKCGPEDRQTLNRVGHGIYVKAVRRNRIPR